MGSDCRAAVAGLLSAAMSLIGVDCGAAGAGCAVSGLFFIGILRGLEAQT